eukprot:GHVS01093960.1.p1 GENE.GHVS01093960.1~~GHVS01093960.1.p1  ORF type:complete len:725 (-),score=81.77 GHVS01093960.1:324-2498(-)
MDVSTPHLPSTTPISSSSSSVHSTSYSCGLAAAVSSIQSSAHHELPSGGDSASHGVVPHLSSVPTSAEVTDLNMTSSSTDPPSERPAGSRPPSAALYLSPSFIAGSPTASVRRTSHKVEPSASPAASAFRSPSLPKTPFGMNRFVLFSIYLMYDFLSGCIYWGWDGIQDMLYKSEAYLSVCYDAPDADLSYTLVGGVSYLDCPHRQQNLNNLYTTAFISHFCCSVFFGAVLDILGPKVCAVIGQVLAAIGWILLGMSSDSRPLYIPGSILIGMAADPGYLPLLSVANLFPKNRSLIMSIAGAVRSCSFAIPVILSLIYCSSSYKASRYPYFCFGYAGVGIGICIIIALLFIPRRAFRLDTDVTPEQQKEHAEDAARAFRASVYTGTMMPPVSMTATDLRDIADEVKGHTPDYASRRSSSRAGSVTSRGTFAGKEGTIEDANSQVDGKGGAEIVSSGSYFSPPAEGMGGERLIYRFAAPEKTFKQVALMWEYLLIVPFFSICLLRGEFFSKNNKQLLVPSSEEQWVREVFRVLNICSFLPGPLFGKLVDKIGIMPVIFFLNLNGIVVYSLVIADNVGMKCAATVFFFIYTSFILSNLYCYVVVMFPPEHFGKLTGIASMAGGLFCLTSLGFTELSLVTLAYLDEYQFAPANAIMIALGIANIGLWGCMYAVRKKRLREGDKMKALSSVAAIATAQTEETVVESKWADGDGGNLRRTSKATGELAS